jgi:hypothetical protein
VTHLRQPTDWIADMIAEHKHLFAGYERVSGENPGSTALELTFEPGYRPRPLEAR